jgi:hypothetical protein
VRTADGAADDGSLPVRVTASVMSAPAAAATAATAIVDPLN